MMAGKRKLPMRVAFCIFVIWIATLGIHVGTDPGGVPVIQSANGYFWDEFLEEKRPLHLIASMEVSHYRLGIPFLFTYSGGAMPASLDLALTTDQKHKGGYVVLEEVTITYEDGQTSTIVPKGHPRAGILSQYEGIPSDQRENRGYYRARIGIPDCVWEKQSFTLNVVGSIKCEGESYAFEEDVGVMYSERGYIYFGWLYFLMGGA